MLLCRKHHNTAVSFRILPPRVLTRSLCCMATIMDSEYYYPSILKLCLVMQQRKKINFIH